MKKSQANAFLLAAVIVLSASALSGQESRDNLDVPGFRPESKQAEAFLRQLASHRIAVLPTLVRTHEGTFYSEASQKAAVTFLKEKKLGIPELRKLRLDVGERKGRFQYAMFQSDLKRIGEIVKNESGSDYFMVVEHLVTPTPSGDIAIGGIHIYVMDAKGRNAFSFLLNSHHKLFVEGQLRSADSSERGRDNLVMKGTQTALAAFEQQVKAALAN